MNGKFNVWNKWDTLKTVMLGDCYGPNFFTDIKNPKIKSALIQIAEETKEDLEYYENVLKQFGCTVLRPKLDDNDSILNYINENGHIQASQGVPRSPLQPRDAQLIIGDKLLYTDDDHPAIFNKLFSYNNNFVNFKNKGPVTEKTFYNYRGHDAVDWPSYYDYIENYNANLPLSDCDTIVKELDDMHHAENNLLHKFPVDAPSITVIGKDIYIDTIGYTIDTENQEDLLRKFTKTFAEFRINKLAIGGHNDGSFHAIKPGAILSLREIQRYENTFPNWDVCYLPNQSWDKVQGFLKIKNQVAGKWWVPEQEHNDEFTYFVETWLQDWVGYVEETVFDVNVLVLDEHHVCVSNINQQVIDFLKKHNMEPVYVPWRHRYFWDGGLHCITLDLYRNGGQQDYFPQRKITVHDQGFD